MCPTISLYAYLMYKKNMSQTYIWTAYKYKQYQSWVCCSNYKHEWYTQGGMDQCWMYPGNDIESSAIITRCNIVRYCINDCRNSGRISLRCWIHKRHTIPRPGRRAMACLFWIFFTKTDRVVTALHCIKADIMFFACPDYDIPYIVAVTEFYCLRFLYYQMWVHPMFQCSIRTM